MRDIELLSEWVLDNICARYETSNQSVLLEYQAPSSHEEVVYYDEVVDDWLLYEVHPPGPRKGDPLKDPRLWRFPSTKSDFTACLINDVPWLVFECFQVDGDVEVTACAAITPEHILSIEFSVNEAKESLFDHSLGMDEIVQTDIRTYMSNVFVTYSSYAKLSERPKMGETDGMG
ncbi:hypothetical protein ONV78_13915 [Hahella sp. CR1]|uniref:hypothetical protein n=1 Tax=Hahella sp. CR1 TaxID=2992807 RepID=UPI00244284ED|nr:hypothetical protein [Hahella sp. CR1]MDG9668835.1 hypothetical protein [Hahella sp. CR1]